MSNYGQCTPRESVDATTESGGKVSLSWWTWNIDGAIAYVGVLTVKTERMVKVIPIMGRENEAEIATEAVKITIELSLAEIVTSGKESLSFKQIREILRFLLRHADSFIPEPLPDIK